MSAHQRWTTLLELIGNLGSITVTDAAAELGVSAATIRRDLDHLAAQQLVTRTRGGAVPADVAYDLPLRHKSGQHTDQKMRIGTAAAELIPQGAIVGLNGGTTTSQVARALVTRAPCKDMALPGHDETFDSEQLSYTVVTNALNIANDLAIRRSVKLVVTGGVVRPSSYELVGPLAEPTLTRIHLDYAVVGVDGFDMTAGATADHEGEAVITARMVAQAGRVIVVTDSSKLGCASFARVCTADAVHVLVTDTGADDDMVAAARAAGIQVVLA